MSRSVGAASTLLLLAVLLGSSLLSPIQEHVYVVNFSQPLQGLKPVGTGSLKAFFDALLILPKSIVNFFTLDASAANRFLVLGAVGCDTTQINLDTDCWSATSGGAGAAGVPGTGDAAILDAASGAGVGTIALAAAPTTGCVLFGDRCFRVNSWSMVGFTGTITVTISNTGDVNDWMVNGAFTLGGTLTHPAAVVVNPLFMSVGTTADFRVGTFNAGNVQNQVTTGSATFFTGGKTFGVLQLGGGGTVSGNVIGDTVTLRGNLGSNSATARVVSGAGFTMGAVSGIGTNIPFTWTAGAGASVTLTQWVTNDFTLGLENQRWVQDVNPVTATVTFVFDCLADNTDYTFERNSVVMATQNAGTPDCFSPQAGRVSIPVTGGWGSGDVMTLLSSALFIPPGGGGSGLRTQFKVDFKDCNTVTLTDTRPEAANGVLWVWNWGDGTPQDTTSVPEATHYYRVRDIYTIQVSVQDRGGSIQTFVGPIDLTTAQCQIFPIAQVLGPYLLGLLILLAVVLLLQIALDKTNKYTRWLIIAFFAMVATIIIFIYFGWSPALPGGIQF